MSVDPTVQNVLRAGLALLFASAALHKLRDLRAFRETLADYRILPRRMTGFATLCVSGAEVGAALALVALPTHPLGPALACSLLAAYGLAIGWNLARGRRDIDCGCQGPAGRLTLGPWLLVRNAVLASGALLLLADPASRATSWIDGVSLVGGLGVLALLWNAIHQLSAVAPAPGRSA